MYTVILFCYCFFLLEARGDDLTSIILKRCNRVENCKSGTNVDLEFFNCLLNPVKEVKRTYDCKSAIFNTARTYFKSDTFRRFVESSCPDDIRNLKCDEQQFVLCVLENKGKLPDFYCQHVVQLIEGIYTSHAALFSNFTEICESDIKHLCQYQLKDQSIVPLDDDVYLDCLQKRIGEIQKNDCRKEIFHISEYQGENIQLDKTLQRSCKLDQVTLCPNFQDQEAIFKCLQDFINSPVVSEQCRQELFKRENLVSRDSNVSKGLVRSCKEDIRVYRCKKLVWDDKNIRLAQMLLCLENAVHNGSKVGLECRSEMIRHRKMLMEDFSLSPEVVSKCAEDIDNFCRGLAKGGKTIHCLMDHSRPRRRSQKVVSDGCQRALEDLVKITDIGEDWRVDPILRRSCAGVVRSQCSDAKGDDSKIMSCLIDNINSNNMEQECEKALMEIQYFISRDFKLDPALFSACQSDAVRLCHAKKSWIDDLSKMDPERGPLVLPCLYRYVYSYESDHVGEKIKLRPSCEEQVRRVMRQRAISVELIPEVEQFCLEDLVLYCADKTKPGEEMLCLQDKYTSLKPKCKSAVGNFTEAESKDINLNPIVKQYCRPVIDIHCKEELKSIKGDPNDIMSCLIKHKNDPDVRVYYKCRAAIDHFQLISINDYRFTAAFKDACRPYVIHYCPKAHTKAQVVECLSGVTQNDTLNDERYKLSKECRYALRAQLLQQREFIDLDPKLKHQCEKDIQKYCSKIDRKSDVTVLECLEDKLSSLSPLCHKMVFQIEQHDFKDSSSDYTLLTTCKLMIKEYCKGIDMSASLTCLKKVKDEPVFDNNCKSLVLKRMVEQSADYRLNPALQRGCSQDIGKFCLSLMKTQAPNSEFEGKILNCLKLKFRERKLRKDCEKQLSVILKEAALNYKLNPLLRNLCTNEITDLCGTEVEAEERGDTGRVEECLKVTFMDGRIKSRACRLEVAGLIEEAKADIHVDPILHSACALDIKKFCDDIPQGAGRILQCLETVLTSNKKHLQPDCNHKLTQRIEMFKNAEPLINDPKNLEELIGQVTRSASKKFFIATLLTLIGMMFLLGLFCGRVTRRSTQMKNK